MDYSRNNKNAINLAKNDIVMATVKSVSEINCQIVTKDGINGIILLKNLSNTTNCISPIDIVKPGQTIKVIYLWSSDYKHYFGYKQVNEPTISTPLDFLFITEDRNTLESIMKNMLSVIENIDSDEKFLTATYLLNINSRYTPILISDLDKVIFDRSTIEYQYKQWKNGYTPYCPTLMLSKELKNTEDKNRKYLLSLCGIFEEKVNSININPVFKNIQDSIIRELNLAETSIKIAIAWFTNFALFNTLLELLKRNIFIEIITNNDLINNGGYCLDLNKLIESGATIHIAEYPEFLHHKFCIIDNKTIINGSYNWTIFSEHINDENVLIIKNSNDISKVFCNEFEKLCKRYSIVDKMPESAPERPEYDRSSFKQYVTEEIIFLSKKETDINKQKCLYSKAFKLSPQHPACQNIPQIIKEDSSIISSNKIIKEDILQKEAFKQALEEKEQERLALEIKIKAEQKKIEQQQVEQKRIEEQRNREQQEFLQKQKEIQDREERDRIEKETEEKRQKQQVEIQKIQIEKQRIEEDKKRLEQQHENTLQEQVLLHKAGQSTLEGNRGKLRINLKWETTDDLDLHLQVPGGQEISYNNENIECQNFKGYLDIDANTDSTMRIHPQENIYWENGVPVGEFFVKVQLFTYRSNQASIPFVITIIPDVGTPFMKSSIFQQTAGKPILTVFHFIYNEPNVIKML